MEVAMKLDDVSIDLGTKGVVLKIYEPNGGHVGDLRIGKATVEWMKGRTREGNGKKVPLRKLLDMIENDKI